MRCSRSTSIVLELGEPQWRYMERRYAQSNDSCAMQPKSKDRLKASIKRSFASIEVSPFNPEAWLVERQRRQQITFSTLQQLANESNPIE